VSGKIVVEFTFLKDAKLKVSDSTVSVPGEGFPGSIRVRDAATGEDLTQHYSVSAKEKKGKISVSIT